MAERTAEVTWRGSLTEGEGRIERVGSGAFGPLDVTWESRTEDSGGKTSPEELIAAAHASCFSMALSHGLSQADTPPERLEVSATVTLDSGKVTSSKLTVRGRVPGIDQAQFEQAARDAGEGCPISGALKGNVDIQVDATLET